MAESLINSIARLRVIEKRLLTKDTVGRLLAAPGYAECLKILNEAGYGESAKTGGDEIEALARASLADAYSLTEELLPGRFASAAGVFRMRHDIINIKLLYKLRMRGAALDSAELDPGGIYDEKALREAIAKGDYSMLPDGLKDALEGLDVSTYKDPDPQAVSREVDNAFIRFARSNRSPFVREYFSAFADFTNLSALARGFELSKLLPAGALDGETLARIAEALKDNPDRIPGMIKSPLEASPLKEKLREGFAEYLRTGHTSAIEKARDEYLISLASEKKSDIDSPAPIIGYMLAREREAEIVRLILTAKRSGIPAQALEERSMALYG